MYVYRAPVRRPVLRTLVVVGALVATGAVGGAAAALAGASPGGYQVQRLPEPALPGPAVWTVATRPAGT